MKLFHYATWGGQEIATTGWLWPSRRYGYGPETLSTPQWPKMVFLTENSFWEPSVQAKHKGMWEKCGSHPEIYAELNIPCWRFKVEIAENLIVPARAPGFTAARWYKMLQDGRNLGSNVEEWYVTREYVPVKKSWKWRNRKWNQLF